MIQSVQLDSGVNSTSESSELKHEADLKLELSLAAKQLEENKLIMEQAVILLNAPNDDVHPSYRDVLQGIIFGITFGYFGQQPSRKGNENS